MIEKRSGHHHYIVHEYNLDSLEHIELMCSIDITYLDESMQIQRNSHYDQMILKDIKQLVNVQNVSGHYLLHVPNALFPIHMYMESADRKYDIFL